MTLTLEEAKEFVRSRIDELAENESDMFNADPENLNIDKTTEENFTEAVDFIHAAASAQLIEGKELTQSDLRSMSVSEGVVDINFVTRPDISILRLQSFKCGDSDVVLSQPVPEDSPVGRMQLNPYIRGRQDNPCLVLMRDSLDRHPHYRYYTTDMEDVTFSLRYIPSATTEDCFVCSRLKDAVLNYLTGSVLRSLGDNRSAAFIEHAKEYIQ